MTIVVDLSGVEAWKGGGILPPGWHLCRIEAADDTQTSRGGHRQLIVEWSAVKGEHAGLGITEWIVITPQSLGKLKALLNAVGIATDEGEVRLEPDVLHGRQAMVFVQNEPDRNDPEKVRSRVKAHDRAVGIAAPVPAAAASSMARHDDIPF